MECLAQREERGLEEEPYRRFNEESSGLTGQPSHSTWSSGASGGCSDDDQRTNYGQRGSEKVGNRRTLAFDDPEPGERRRDVDAAICRIRASRKAGVHTCQHHSESDEAHDAHRGDDPRASLAQPHPERKTAGNLQQSRESKRKQIGDHGTTGPQPQRLPKSPRMTQSGPGPPAHWASQSATKPTRLRSSARSSRILARTASRETLHRGIDRRSPGPHTL